MELVELIFVPYKQIGKLTFGMQREDAWKICGKYQRTFKYGFPVEDRFDDDYGNYDLLFSKDQKLEAVMLFPEFFVDKSRRFILNYQGKKVPLSTDTEKFIHFLTEITDSLTEDEDGEGYSDKTLGLKIYCPEREIENIIIHDRHCYDEEQEYIKNNL